MRADQSAVIRDRDIEVFKFVFKHRVATFEQIRRQFFEGKDRTTICKRLSRLCAENYLKRGRIDYFGSGVYYMPTERSFEFIKSAWKFEIDKPHFKSESIEHDIHATEVAMKFSRLSRFVDYVPENLLQSSSWLADSEKFSDLVKFQTDGGLRFLGENKQEYLFSLEVEMSCKNPQRYTEKLQSYYLSENIDGVLYVCKDQTIINCLAKVDKEVHKDDESRLHFALLENVLTSKNELTFENRDGERMYFS